MKQKYTFLFLISGLVVVIDQLTKFLVLTRIPLHETITVIPGFMNITHVQNSGVAFGLFSGGNSNLQQMLLMGAAVIAVCVIFYFYTKTAHELRWMLVGFALIIGGAIGNIIDRIRLSQVVDFIEVYAGRFVWPSFNVADSAISVGIVIFFYYMIFKRPENL